MLSKNATGPNKKTSLPPMPISQTVADHIVRESMFRMLSAHQFEDALAHLEKHPDMINAVNEDGVEAIRYAVFANDAGVVYRLAVRGADINRKGNDGWNPVMEAAHLGYSSVLEVLISQGADINTKTPMGWTPIQLALMQGHSEAARVLIMAGANLNDGPMKGMYAADLIENVALDQEVVWLIIEKTRLAQMDCCNKNIETINV